MRKLKRNSQFKKGFTLIELLVSVGIFIIMTTLLMVKYGNFNQSVLMTNLAYDVAITIRTAQTYGLSVKNLSKVEEDVSFASGYGVYFSTSTTPPENNLIIFFEDTESGNLNMYDYADTIVDTYTIKRGAYISDICTGTTCGINNLSVVFKRPDPNAQICYNNDGAKVCVLSAEIFIMGTDRSTRSVRVRENGQISVIE
ncbi:MAG: type II secretion system GspH family protein [bacterium]|nr:type II secretion system GspH family protein [bacterium]